MAKSSQQKFTPDDFFYEDKRLMPVMRIVGFCFPILMVVVEILVRYNIFHSPSYRKWAFWPTVVGFTVVGITLYVWQPITRNKNKIWFSAFVVLGIIGSIGIFGFPTVTFMGWLILIMAMGLMLSLDYAIFGFFAMLFSLSIWLITSPGVTAGIVIESLISVVAMSLILLLIGGIWRLFLDSINQLQLSREEERIEHTRLTTLINDMVDGVLAIDSRGIIKNYNAAALDVLDVNESLANKNISAFLRPIDENGHRFNLKKFLDNLDKAEVLTNLQIPYKDGSKISLYLAIAPVRQGFGHKTNGGFTLIMRDITREKSLEEERDEFISVVSHELRTPIAITEGSISNVEFVLKNNKSKNSQDLIKKAVTEAHNQVLFLAEMINDLSTLSRAERGKLEIDISEIDVYHFLDELLENYTPDAKAKGLDLRLKHGVKLPKLHSSQLYVHEILQNFITNAIKYTETGSVVIGAKPKEGGVEFYVSDTGIGLNKADQVRVFDKFFRSEDYRTRKNSGTGLGLYVTTKLARLLNADINLTSELNKGTTFSVFFPDLEQSETTK